MSNAHFDLVILHHSSVQPVETLVRDVLDVLNKQGDPYLEYKLSEALLFEENRTAILENLTQEQGEHYQRQFREFLIETELRPTLQLVTKSEQNTGDEEQAQHTCPACGHVQAKAKEGMNTCQSCGLVGEKFIKQQKREEIFLKEKRKLEDNQDKGLKEAQERAGLEEEERLRREARQRLGLEKKKRPLDILVGVTVVALMGVAGYFINQTLTTPEATPEVAGAAGSKGETAPDTATGNEASKTTDNTPASTTENPATAETQAVNLQAPANAAVADLKGTDPQGKQIKLTVSPPGGTRITMSGVSDPMDRPVVETSGLLPGEGKQPGNPPASASGKAGITPQATAMTNGTATTGTQGNASMQIARIVPAEHLTPLQAAAGATSAGSLPTDNPSAQQAQELEALKNALRPAQPERFFTKLSTEDYTRHQQKLDRLLTLEKPELAIVYLEPVEDHYAASLMLLKIARYEAKQKSTANKTDLLNAMQNRRLRSAETSQEMLIAANLSQAYDMMGEEKQAETLLDEAVAKLENSDGTTLSEEQKMELMLQMSQDQQAFGNADEARALLQKAQLMVVDLPEDNTLLQTQAFTQLASTSIAEGNFTEAEEWLDKIADPVVREQLLSYLNTLKSQQ